MRQSLSWANPGDDAVGRQVIVGQVNPDPFFFGLFFELKEQFIQAAHGLVLIVADRFDHTGQVDPGKCVCPALPVGLREIVQRLALERLLQGLLQLCAILFKGFGCLHVLSPCGAMTVACGESTCP